MLTITIPAFLFVHSAELQVLKLHHRSATWIKDGSTARAARSDGDVVVI
jgi:hypothetical protein